MENEALSSIPFDKSSKIDLQLIDKIIQKSEEKKFNWQRTNTGYLGRAAKGSLSVQITKQNVPIWGPSWKSFVVSRGPEEILKLENDALSLASLAGLSAAESALHKKIAELLAWLDTARQRQVKAAISELDEI